jgi:ATP-binding cassette subfamily B protein
VLRRQWWTAALAAIAAAAALGVPAWYALAGRIGPHQLVTCLFAGLSVFGISRVGPEAFDIDHGITSVEAVDRLTARFGTTATPRGAAQPAAAGSVGPPTVRFEDVVFTYPGTRRPVLNGLCLTLHPGQTVAVVGENGAGKTTLVKLLTGLYVPTAGRITVDGVNLAYLDPVWWRHRIVAVFQDFVQYPASLGDNVALGAPERLGDRSLAASAIRRSGDADLLAELRSGLDTSLWKEGAGGTDLSGGQWQRVALARALFAAAAGRRLVVLDEPTAHLDARAEASFHEHVMRSLSDTTTVVVSHRLSTVRTAERIVMLRDGRVAEVGTHAELIALGGGYARFFDLQAAAYAGSAR